MTKSSSDLRDWFAGMALLHSRSIREADLTPVGTAVVAFIVADEMIKARDLSREELDAALAELVPSSRVDGETGVDE